MRWSVTAMWMASDAWRFGMWQAAQEPAAPWG